MDTLIKILFVIVFPAFAIYFFIKYSKLKKKTKKLNKEKSREITNLETQNSE